VPGTAWWMPMSVAVLPIPHMSSSLAMAMKAVLVEFAVPDITVRLAPGAAPSLVTLRTSEPRLPPVQESWKSRPLHVPFEERTTSLTECPSFSHSRRVTSLYVDPTWKPRDPPLFWSVL
jgi:hypothetical protein